jgi:hypothetical protein
MAKVIVCNSRRDGLARMADKKELAVATPDEYPGYMLYFEKCREIIDQGDADVNTIVKFITKYRCDVVSIIEPPHSKIAGKELVWAIPRKYPAFGCVYLPPGSSIQLPW